MKMADEDEIDILGDFSFNSCFAQNNQGILSSLVEDEEIPLQSPSCSSREDTVHPQWLLDSTANNWYDIQSKSINRETSLSRKLSESSADRDAIEVITTWNQMERQLLAKEMAKYGRNVRKISETITSKSEAEIQALIDAEFGVNLDTPIFGLEKHEEDDNVPTVVQEVIVTDDTSHMTSALSLKTGGLKKPFRKKTYTTKPNNNSLLKSNLLVGKSKTDLIAINPSEIFYEEDLIIGSQESIGSDLDSTDIVSKNIGKCQKPKVGKKNGNHRRKVPKNNEKTTTKYRSKDLLKSPQGRQRKDSSRSEESLKSPKMQIVLGSGQALPLSEGEQVIKIEKKKDSDPESDIEIDVDSDNEKPSSRRPEVLKKSPKLVIDEAPIAVPLRKFEPMPRRQKKINLDGGGGYTIMHTEAGDLYAVGSEPKKERAPRKHPVPLMQCRLYNAEKPAPYTVMLNVSALVSMDAHAHTSRAEVMGLLGGRVDPPAPAATPTVLSTAPVVLCAEYKPAAAAAGATHCDMDPVSQSQASEWLLSRGWAVCGWHHSHPGFPPAPSALDLRQQRALQRALERRRPFLALITSQHWPAPRAASSYRCIRVEDHECDSTAVPTGYQLSVKLQPDLTLDRLPSFLRELAGILRSGDKNQFSVDMVKDICPQANLSYLDKCISSVSQHMRSAGYEDHDPVTERLLQGIRDVFR